jgi:dTDP-4-dehydrorhamnose 3,5-epimerase-like enzyme
MNLNIKTPTMLSFPRYLDPNGVLCVYESGQHVPFDIRRIFTVSATKGDSRGDHAHKQCSQLLVCVSGRIQVSCDNGSAVTNHVIDSMNCGLLVPPGIWAKEEFLTDGAVLMVVCDRGYEEDDYIRDYEKFKAFVAS